MSKPKWEDAPPWARYLAMDECGRWYWYECKPTHDSDEWKPIAGRFEGAEIPINWMGTLEQRPLENE